MRIAWPVYFRETHTEKGTGSLVGKGGADREGDCFSSW